MKLWKLLLVSFVVAWLLPPLGFLLYGMFLNLLGDYTLEGIGFFLFPVIILVFTSFNKFLVWGGFFLINFVIVFIV